MKLTKETLKTIIKEELETVLNEINIAPNPNTKIPITDKQLGKIHDTIEKGDLEQAQAFIDAFEGDPDYVQKYIEYGRPMEFERMGQATADMYHPMVKGPYGSTYRKLKDEYSFEDIMAADLAASKKMIDRAKEELGPNADKADIRKKIDALMKRYRSGRDL